LRGFDVVILLGWQKPFWQDNVTHLTVDDYQPMRQAIHHLVAFSAAHRQRPDLATLRLKVLTFANT
jgi:hypothetical protein